MKVESSVQDEDDDSAARPAERPARPPLQARCGHDTRVMLPHDARLDSYNGSWLCLCCNPGHPGQRPAAEDNLLPGCCRMHIASQERRWSMCSGTKQQTLISVLPS